MQRPSSKRAAGFAGRSCGACLRPARLKAALAALGLAVLLGLLCASPVWAATATTSRALDYLAAHERTDGGFSYAQSAGNPQATLWATLAIAAAGYGPSRFVRAGHSPIAYLQDTDLASAAAASGNAPVFYAQCILAFRAAGRSDLLYGAGTGQLDLLSALASYQCASGCYAATAASLEQATQTTAWALLGLAGAEQSGPQASAALQWLTSPQAAGGGGPNPDGGFGPCPGSASTVTDTALVLEALQAARLASSSSEVQGAAHYLATMQLPGGGFQESTAGYANALSSAWAIGGLEAAGLDPHSYTIGGRSAFAFLARLQQANGSLDEYASDLGDVLSATCQSLIAFSRKTLASPLTPTSERPCPDLPHFLPGALPAQHARLTSASVLVKARYADSAGGTGIARSRVRLQPRWPKPDRQGPRRHERPLAKARQAR